MYFASGALARKVEKLAVDTWKETKLAPSHAYLLMIVLDKPGVQPTTLVEELLLAPSTITRLIEKLEQKKLVRRTMEGKITNVFPTVDLAREPAKINGLAKLYAPNNLRVSFSRLRDKSGLLQNDDMQRRVC